MRWTPILCSLKSRLTTIKKGENVSKVLDVPKKSHRPKGQVSYGMEEVWKKQKLHNTVDFYRVQNLDQALKILRFQYENLIIDTDGKPIDFFKFRTKDIKADTYGKNLLMFDQMLDLKRNFKKPISKYLLHVLLGVNPSKIKDNLSLTNTVVGFLKEDGNSERASRLLQVSHRKNIVAANKLLEYYLAKKQVTEALKLYNNCKKWKLVPNVQTGVILFDGMSKSLDAGKFNEHQQEVLNKLVELYESLPKPQISVFNALLSCLVKNYNDDQAMAWAFFDKLQPLQPDVVTFSIFLKGLMNLKKYKYKQISEDVKISAVDKFVAYHNIENEFITNAQLVRGKVEQIDDYFARDYVNCLKEYPYVTHGLEQLYNWSKDFKTISDDLKLIFNYSKDLKYQKSKELIEMMNKADKTLEYTPTEALDADYSKVDIGMNKFLLQQIIDGLSRLDRPIQFLNFMWYILKMYGGIEFNTLPRIGDDHVEVEYDSADSKVIDHLMIEYMLFYMDKQFAKEMKSSSIAIQLLKYVKPSMIDIKSSTYAMAFNILNDELTYFNRFNYNEAYANKVKQGSKKNIPEETISVQYLTLTEPQVKYLIENLNKLIQLVPKQEFTEDVAKLLERIIRCEWAVSTFKEYKILNNFVVETIQHEEPKIVDILKKAKYIASTEFE